MVKESRYFTVELGVVSYRSPASVKSENDSDWKNTSWDGWITIVYSSVPDREIVYNNGDICDDGEMVT